MVTAGRSTGRRRRRRRPGDRAYRAGGRAAGARLGPARRCPLDNRVQLHRAAASPEARLVSESTIPMDKVLGEHMMAAGAEPDDPPWPGIPAPRSNPDAGSAGAGLGDQAK